MFFSLCLHTYRVDYKRYITEMSITILNCRRRCPGGKPKNIRHFQIQSCQTCTHLSIKVPKSSLMVFWMFSVHSQLHWSFISKHKIFRAISARAVSASSQTSKFGSVKVGLDFRLYQINVLISHKIIKATTRSQSALIINNILPSPV